MDKFRLLSLNITTKCNLKCEKCLMHAPYVNPPFFADHAVIEKSLEKAFRVYGAVKELRLSGGEVWFHPQIIDIMQTCAKFSSCYDTLMIITNGTYIPKAELLDAMAGLSAGLLIRIDDYGPLSTKIEELKATLDSYKIPYEVRPYSDEEQMFGGWLDLGDLSYVGGTEEELKERFQKCQMFRGCNQVIDGIGYPCPVIFFLNMRKGIPPKEAEQVNYLSDIPVEEMKAIVAGWENLPYFSACNYCKGYDPTRTDRIKPAIQLEDAQ